MAVCRPDRLNSRLKELAGANPEKWSIPKDIVEMSSATETGEQPATKGDQQYMTDKEYVEHIKKREQEIRQMLLALRKASKVWFNFSIRNIYICVNFQ